MARVTVIDAPARARRGLRVATFWAGVALASLFTDVSFHWPTWSDVLGLAILLLAWAAAAFVGVVLGPKIRRRL